MIPRFLEEKLTSRIGKGKVILLFGPRQVGKTTLVKSVLKKLEVPSIFLNGDEPDIQQLLYRKSSTELKALIGQHKIVVIDEAQRIQGIGLTLKLMVDNIPDVQFIATGSSSLELANEANEALTGRKYEYFLYPLAYQEIAAHEGALATRRLLNHRLVYGNYPEIVTNLGNEEELLRLIADSYLYKDILTMTDIRKPELLQKILQALAYQAGSEVSYHEIAQLTGADNQTVERYIDLMEKAFIIFRLGAFSRNLRNELKRSRKIYFWDTGIRNALISNFNPIEKRTDVGALWENFLVAERIKMNHYKGKWPNRFFWRTRTQQELDYLEETGGNLYAFEFRWNPKTKKKIPKSFLEAYPESETAIIDPNNFLKFLG